MATTRRTQGVIAGGALAVAALIALLFWSRNHAPVPAPAPIVVNTAAPSPEPAAAPSSPAPPAPAAPAALAPAAPAPAESPSSRKTNAALKRWQRLNAHTQTYRLMALRVLRENRIEARLAELYCMDTVCRGALVEGTPDEYARWADLMSGDTSTRFDSFQWSLRTVDGSRRMDFSIYVPTPKAAP